MAENAVIVDQAVDAILELVEFADQALPVRRDSRFAVAGGR